MNEFDKQYIIDIKDSYEEKSEEDKNLDELKKLDKKVRWFPKVFSIGFGTIATLILGLGMSIIFGVVFGSLYVLGIVLGVIGSLFMAITYPLYSLITKKKKAKYKDEIITLSNELLNEN